MFTGIIEETGSILSLEKGHNSILIKIKASVVLQDTKIGDSIAVNGVCLTVTQQGTDYFKADAMHETINRTTLNKLTQHSTVNLERALRLDTRLGGHIVSGHVDTIGCIKKIVNDGIAKIYSIQVPKNWQHLIVEKGSITIDGISLTIVDIKQNIFSVSLIPHTVENTNFKHKKIGDLVNLETDIIGKYLFKFTQTNLTTMNQVSLKDLL